MKLIERLWRMLRVLSQRWLESIFVTQISKRKIIDCSYSKPHRLVTKALVNFCYIWSSDCIIGPLLKTIEHKISGFYKVDDTPCWEEALPTHVMSPHHDAITRSRRDVILLSLKMWRHSCLTQWRGRFSCSDVTQQALHADLPASLNKSSVTSEVLEFQGLAYSWVLKYWYLKLE